MLAGMETHFLCQGEIFRETSDATPRVLNENRLEGDAPGTLFFLTL